MPGYVHGRTWRKPRQTSRFSQRVQTNMNGSVGPQQENWVPTRQEANPIQIMRLEKLPQPKSGRVRRVGNVCYSCGQIISETAWMTVHNIGTEDFPNIVRSHSECYREGVPPIE